MMNKGNIQKEQQKKLKKGRPETSKTGRTKDKPRQPQNT